MKKPQKKSFLPALNDSLPDWFTGADVREIQDPSKGAVPLAGGAGSAGALVGGEAEAAPATAPPRSPIAALDERVADEAYTTRQSPRDVLKRMFGLQ